MTYTSTDYGLELLVELGIGRQVDIGVWDTGVWGVAVWGETDTSLGDWVDVTCDVADPFQMGAGSSSSEGIVSRWEAATAALTLYGDEYDPWNGPYAGILGPGVGVRIRWRAAGGSTWTTAFTGRVGAAGWTWTPKGAGEPVAKTEVKASDKTAILVGYDYAGTASAVGADETGSARVARLLNTAQWPAADRVITTGGVRMRPTKLKGKVWEQLLVVSDTDLALLWVDRAGKVRYIPSGRVGQGAQYVGKIVICPAVGSDIQMVKLDAAVFGKIRNSVSLSHFKDDGASTDPPVTTVKDDASAARYGWTSLNRTDLTYSDLEESWWPSVVGNAILTSQAWPSPAPSSVALDTRVDTDAATLLLTLEPHHTFDLTDTGDRTWRACVMGWALDVGTKAISGSITVDDVGRWTGGRWDSAGWDRDRWGFNITGG